MRWRKTRCDREWRGERKKGEVRRRKERWDGERRGETEKGEVGRRKDRSVRWIPLKDVKLINLV